MSCPVGLALLSHNVTCELSPPVASCAPSGDHATQMFIEVRPGLRDVTSHRSVLTNTNPKPPEENITKLYFREEKFRIQLDLSWGTCSSWHPIQPKKRIIN